MVPMSDPWAQATNSAREALAELAAGRIGRAMLLIQRGSAAFSKAEKQTVQTFQKSPGFNRVSMKAQTAPESVDTAGSGNPEK